MTTYVVDGMTCQGCARSVTNALTAALGEVSVAIDLASKQVSVTPDPADLALVEQTITQAGFEFGGVAGS